MQPSEFRKKLETHKRYFGVLFTFLFEYVLSMAKFFIVDIPFFISMHLRTFYK